MRGLWAALESGGLALAASIVMLVLAVAYGLYTNHQASSGPADAAVTTTAPAQ